MSRVDITFTQPAPVAIGQSVYAEFTVHNDTSDHLPSQRLQLIGDNYWRSSCSVAVPSIAPYSTSRPVTLKMNCRWTSDAALVPSKFTVRLDMSNIARTFEWSFWTFTQGLRDYNTSRLPGAAGTEKFMLLCFGQAGSGKSSFFNSVLTLMHQGEALKSSLHTIFH